MVRSLGKARLHTKSGLPRSFAMRVFLDFEASSLGKQGFPIEVAWVFESGEAESHLIRPAPKWTDWDPRAEAIHGLARETLAADGESHDSVARRMIEALSGHDLYASAPSWDGKWLSALLRAAGLPRHALRLRDSELAQRESARQILSGLLDPEALRGHVDSLVARIRMQDVGRVKHRALDDAEQERQRWLAVVRLAEAEAARFHAGAVGDQSRDR
jgi:hypothetical protein